MSNNDTFNFSPLAFLSVLIIVPPIFFLLTAKAGIYFNRIHLFFYISIFLFVPLLIGITALAERAPFILIIIDILVAFAIYYFVMIWDPYPIYVNVLYKEKNTTLKSLLSPYDTYQGHTVLNGPIKSYHENHYVLSGSPQKPRKGSQLTKTMIVFFDQEGHNIKDSLIYRNSPLDRPYNTVNTYSYNEKGQLIDRNKAYFFYYREDGRLSSFLEQRTTYSKNQPTDRRILTTYTYDQEEKAVIATSRGRYIDTYSTEYDTVINKDLVNDAGLVLYDGSITNGKFSYLTKYEYNEANQLIALTDFFYNITRKTYVYDTLGRLKIKKEVIYSKDETQTYNEESTKYDTLGYDLYIKESTEYDTLGYEVYKNKLYYNSKDVVSTMPYIQNEYFYRNEYDEFNNLVKQSVFIQEDKGSLRPHYMITVDLMYYNRLDSE